jgi:hypothetical protein
MAHVRRKFVDSRRSQAATISEGDVILINAETFKIIGEPMGDAPGLVAAREAMAL